MIPTKLQVRGEYAVLETPRELSAFCLDGERLHAWPRPLIVENDDNNDDAAEEALEDSEARSVTGYVLDPAEPRLALLWKRHDGEVHVDEVDAYPYSSEVELVDLGRNESHLARGLVAHVETLIALAPGGSLFTDSEATGLAAYHAFRSTAVQGDPVEGGLLENLSSSPFHPSAGNLIFALGFTALPHVQQLAFSADTRRAWSGSCSQYQSHLALLKLGTAPGVVRAENIEVLEIVALPGFAEAVVLETGHAGPRRLSIWDTETATRKRDLIDEPNLSIMIRGLSIDPRGSAIVALLTDGTAACANVASDGVRRFPVCKAREPFDTALLAPGELAVDFAAGRFAVAADGRVAAFDFEGNELASLGRGDAVDAHAGSFFVRSNARVTIVDANGKKRVWKAKASIIASSSSPHGVVVADEEHRIAIVR